LLATPATQAIGIALPGRPGSAAAALLSAVLFGGTFLGAVILAMVGGNHLRAARSTAALTNACAAGPDRRPVPSRP
jgi:hypothetical protein